MLLYDISISPDAPEAVYCSDPPTKIFSVGDYERQGYRLSCVQMSMHAGTHIDFPAHFIKEGSAAADYGLERFVLRAEVVTLNQVEQALREIKPGKALIVKTKTGEQLTGSSGLSLEIARQCVTKGLSMVGIDQISIECGSEFPVHVTLLQAGILILENLNLSQVPPGSYQLVCWPLKISTTEAAPARAVLIGDGELIDEES